jgi:hypothetical protein
MDYQAEASGGGQAPYPQMPAGCQQGTLSITAMKINETFVKYKLWQPFLMVAENETKVEAKYRDENGQECEFTGTLSQFLNQFSPVEASAALEAAKTVAKEVVPQLNGENEVLKQLFEFALDKL